MELCDDRHTPICYECKECPLCEALIDNLQLSKEAKISDDRADALLDENYELKEMLKSVDLA